ncbi:MAG: threonine aldolase [Candidatus Micrarchaeota archaeon]|nr:threonine aldolase [Candidatus Micrarchaeota archaeon]MDE1848378.1 threonine aldolase [Candidatus Micrarchaeota archaeon]MDE1864978.1 threonine aldolase [Candidatus Micrarchaeota archaeon]
MEKRGFGSDNGSGIHPKVLKAITEVNKGHSVAYGYDKHTEAAIRKFREHLGEKVDVYFVFNGTAANTLGLQGLVRSYNSVICADCAHLNVDECGSPEKFLGCKLIPIKTSDGKITPGQIIEMLADVGFEHRVQPMAVSITQPTEYGTLYTVKEVRAIAKVAHGNNLYLHMDGARIANAAAALGITLKGATFDCGVDVLSFGGTKNGLMLGDAVVFRDSKLAGEFKYVRKQGMQLASKMRFISAQFVALLSDDLWLENAQHSNRMAKLLADRVSDVPEVRITQKVQTNAVFAAIPKSWISKLMKEYFFYIWDESTSEVRWMTSFDTAEEDVDKFAEYLRKLGGR